MIPVAFDGCAGWMDVGSGSTGIVFCAPWGREGMLTYRGCKVLADSLHARGFSVLRFDYPGTGDSSGDETDPGRLEAWQKSIAAATRCLREATSCTGVILIGLRLGATLALRAAASDASIVAACCLSPVVSGRSYTRELRLLANGWREASLLPAPSATTAYLDVVGDRLEGDTVRALSTIDLRTIERTAPEILLMSPEGTASLDQLADRLSSLGARVERQDFPGAIAFLQDPFATRLPHQAFESVTSWCVAVAARTTARSCPPALSTSSRLLRLPDSSEEGGHFGPNGGLYGVFCHPTGQKKATAPAVLMLNTGFGRRTGDGRIFVTLSRRLAGLGVSSFRIDVRGCGESDGRDDGVIEPYAPEIVDDVVAAAQALAHRGFDRLIVVGICSGAHAAFHAGLRDPRVAGMILVNLQKFVWQLGTPLSVEKGRPRRPAAFYLKSVARKDVWLRMMKGKIAVGAIATALLRRVIVTGCNKGWSLLERRTGIPTPAGQVRRWLIELGLRGVRINLLYSDGDPGLSELAVSVGSQSRSVRDLSHVAVEVLPQADHALLDHDARQRFVDRVCQIVRDSDTAS